MVQIRINEESQKKVKNEIRSYMVAKGHTFESLAKLLSERYNRNDTAQNISNKLQRGTIKYAEVLEIAEVLGYKLAWSDNTK